MTNAVDALSIVRNNPDIENEDKQMLIERDFIGSY
jgi:hypothetical protein